MIRYFPDLIQGSDEWMAARCGLLTASEMKHILTPTLRDRRQRQDALACVGTAGPEDHKIRRAELHFG